MKTTMFAVATATLISTCNGGSDESSSPTPVLSEIRDGVNICSPGSVDYVETHAVRLDAEADLLEIDVEYLGGCAPHEMMLCWNGWSTNEENPELLGFFVDHYDNGDTCSNWVTETVTFDVSQIRYDYWSEGGGFGEDDYVTLVFEGGTHTPGPRVSYDFE